MLLLNAYICNTSTPTGNDNFICIALIQTQLQST